MKTRVFALLLAFIVWSAETQAYDPSLCKVQSRLEIYTLSDIYSKLRFPCRYRMVSMECGQLEVEMIPGNVFNGVSFNVDTLDIKIKNASGVWEGSTTNDRSIQYLARNVSSPFTVGGGSWGTSDLFSIYTFRKTKEDGTVFGEYFAWTKDFKLRITFQPYFETLNRAGILTYYCNTENTPPAFPAHICGGRNASDFYVEAERLGFTRNGIYNDEIRDKTIYYHVFTDSTVEQTDQKCGSVVDLMVNECPNESRRAKAINRCYVMFYREFHRTCAASFAEENSMELIDVFYQCLKFVCSGFTDDGSCQVMSNFLNACPDYPNLAEKVAQC